MGKAARHSEALTTQELLRQCEDKLTPVISTMTGMAASKDDMAQRMQALGSTAAELHNLVDDVAKLAQQTNLLSLNAAIEAARAGEHGRGFGVVATEVRRLSMDSAKTAGRIRERIGEISQIMTEAGETAVKTAQQEEQAIQRTSHMVQEVVAHVHQLGTNAEQLAAESHEILRNVESLIMGLQFQDRVSQAVDILNRDILKLETLLPEVQERLRGIWTEPLALSQADFERAAEAHGTSLAACIDRLGARLGAGAVRRPAPVASHEHG